MLDHDVIGKLQNPVPSPLQSPALLPLNPGLPYLPDNSTRSNLNQRSSILHLCYFFFCGVFYGMEKVLVDGILQNNFYYAKELIQTGCPKNCMKMGGITGLICLQLCCQFFLLRVYPA